MSTDQGHVESQPKRTALLALGALGVVFGDIGTSPLYALNETFFGHHKMAPSPDHVFGVISIVFWTMLMVVTVKYVLIMMRADNKGEGGSLSLLALISRRAGPGRWSVGLTMLGIFATALFFGDAMITPAVSVLSAVEGLELINPGFARLVIPLALVILVGLFLFQKRGTEKVGLVFGPIMLVYFAVLAVLGARQVFADPTVLGALSPHYGVRFFVADPAVAFLALGSIVLAVTGAETLYADMGHFGRTPIRLAWLAIAFPTLMLNYLGQGAVLLRGDAAGDNPFYLLASAEWRLPLVLLATVATVIASQAVITGAFSITQQAVQLGLLPRLRVLHTSAKAQGQIYVPLVNWTLLAAVILLVLMFRSSSNLASAYGIAVTGTMFITTVMLAVVLRRLWNWPKPVAIFTVILFGIVDGAYFLSNVTKIADGGWFPLLVAGVAFTLLTTWSKGRSLIEARLSDGNMPVPIFVQSVSDGVHRVGGTAIYLTSTTEGIPPALLHNLKHNQVLHADIVLLTVAVQGVPVIAPDDRVSVQQMGSGMRRIVIRYGFTEDPDIPAALAHAEAIIGKLSPARTSYFISRQTVIASKRHGMALWREHLFAGMLRNSATAMDFFKLPPNRVVELGSQVEI
ncbi:MAG: potassium transporter Kup [Pseudomonadota bacterium]|nr:potassium transporter Kup [Pseudomonadota bacterium]